jgi:hypothetical protein
VPPMARPPRWRRKGQWNHHSAGHDLPGRTPTQVGKCPQETSTSGSCPSRDAGTPECSLNGRRVDVQCLSHSGKRIASLIAIDRPFDFRWRQLWKVYPSGYPEAFKVVCHRSAMDTEASSQFLQRLAGLVIDSNACKFRRGESTLDWPCWGFRPLVGGGGADVIDALA